MDSQYLNTIVHGNRKPVREYIIPFNREKVVITNPNMETIINAFCNGLQYGLDLWKEFTRYPCKNFEDVITKAWYIKDGTRVKCTDSQWAPEASQEMRAQDIQAIAALRKHRTPNLASSRIMSCTQA